MVDKLYLVSELDEFLKRFECMGALIEIGKLSRRIFNTSRAFDEIPITVKNRIYLQTISQWGLAFLAYRAIMTSNDGRSELLSDGGLMEANRIVNNLYDPVVDDGDVTAALSRMSQEQFPWQEVDIPELLARYEYIFGLDDFFEQHFASISSLSLRDYFVIGYAICAYLREDRPVFKISNLTNVNGSTALKEVLREENVKNFLGVASANYQKIRDISRQVNKNTDPKYGRFEFNALLKYPIIEGDRRFPYYSRFQFVVPNILALVRKIAQGAYWDLRFHFEQLHSQDFLSRFGTSFEMYCGNLLKEIFGTEKVKPVEEVIGSIRRDEERADWLVFDKENIYIFECKSSLLRLIVRQMFKQDDFDGWVADNLKKGFDQVNNTERLLRQNAFADDKQIHKFVLLLEDVHFVEISDLQTSLIRALKLESPNVYFMRIYELEKIEQVIKKYGFASIIRKKIEIDNENNISHGRDFLFASKKIDGSANLRSQFLETIYNRIFSEFGASS